MAFVATIPFKLKSFNAFSANFALSSDEISIPKAGQQTHPLLEATN
jgi:hypothetical protein